MFLYDYRWHVDGRYLAILQRAVDSVYDPYVTLEDDLFLTPQNADSEAILVRHTASVSVPEDVTTDMGISRELFLAVVHYIKSKLVEDSDVRMYEWHRKKFHYYVERHNFNLKGNPPSTVMPNYLGAVK